jgi:hypothetical protein
MFGQTLILTKICRSPLESLTFHNGYCFRDVADGYKLRAIDEGMLLQLAELAEADNCKSIKIFQSHAYM